MKHSSTLLFFFIVLLLGSIPSYSQTTRWKQLSDFPGGARTGAFSFAIGTKIYIGGGSAGNSLKSDFWEYDTNTGVWTQKADFGGGKRYFAVAFSIGSKGYAGTGAINNGGDTLSKDFWEYNPATNKWTRKADFGGGIREQAFGAATSSKGYVGTGLSSKDITSLKSDSWEYNPATNKWTKRANLGFFPRFGASAFGLNGKIYAGTGINILAQTVKDFYEYNPAKNRWRRKAAYGGSGVYNAVGFTIGSTGYIGTGLDDNRDFHADFWAYNVSKNKWTKAPTLPGAARTGTVAAGSGKSGYLLTGYNGKNLADVWALVQTSATVVSAADQKTAVAQQPETAAAKIYPNPATTQFTITVNKGIANAQTTVLIYTMHGNVAMKYNLGNISGNFTKTIDVSALASGMYKVVIERDATRESMSLLIAR